MGLNFGITLGQCSWNFQCLNAILTMLAKNKSWQNQKC